MIRLAAKNKRRITLQAVALAVTVAVGTFVATRDWTPTGRLRRQAESALLRGDFAAAEQLAKRLMDRTGQRAAGLLIAGEAVSRLERPQEALDFLAQIRSPERNVMLAAATARGRILLTKLFRLGQAEQAYREALQCEPGNRQALEQLSYILGLQGRSWEAEPHRVELLRQARYDVSLLTLLALGASADENPEEVARFDAVGNNEPRVLCAAARGAMRENATPRALRLLRRAVAAEKELVQAQAWLGSMLATDGNPDEFLAWHAALPPTADSHPDVWYVRGTWARRTAQNPQAVRCFWEAVRIDPNHQPANYQLAQTLITLGQSDEARPFLERARRLGELIVAAKSLQLTGHPDAIRTAAHLTAALGLVWEHRGWLQALEQHAPRPFGERTADGESLAELPDTTGRTDPLRLPGWRPDPAVYPLPDWRRTGADATRDISAAIVDRTFHFIDVAEELGIDFQYVNGSRRETAGEFMYEFSGGGVGVLDYDADGWPDLYWTQGSEWPPRDEQRRHLDRLYRNVAGQRYVDATASAGIVESRFSQGLAAGDFDNDGFSDLYVANIGPNRLYHNNGDGTFRDVTDATGTGGGDAWTTSCAIADFNGDGWPDIFAVNYVHGPGLFDRPCLLPDGSPRLCTPHEFAATDDQLFLNLGDGRFREIARDAGLQIPDGKGLGVVVADFDGSGRLSLFVANDSVPNFFFVNQTSAPGDLPRFEERGFAAGVAVNGDGQPLASMGVAAGDADGNGLLDLFVTTFRLEPKTLLLQESALLFVDATRAAGLREPGYDMLGFGAQFLDADLDGLPDLVSTNGHVGNLSRHGIPYHMPTQFFRNTDAGRFAEIPAARLGPFFSGKYLGRGLARLDWNRDGREDFALSRLEAPVALVSNRTPTMGHFLAVQLRGVASNRDAIGAVVTLTAGGRSRVQHLAAGDGYFASNQKQLIFGLGSVAKIDELTVRWPSGPAQSTHHPQIDSEVLLIEGRDEAILLSR